MTFSVRPSKQDDGLSMTSSFVSRRTLFKHLGGAVAATALTSSLQACSPARGTPASGTQLQETHTTVGTPTGKPSGTNVVLVHGAFVDASSWSSVTPLLQQAGHQVLAVQLPLTSLADDVGIGQTSRSVKTQYGRYRLR